MAIVFNRHIMVLNRTKMKRSTIHSIVLVLGILFLFQSCNNTKFEEPAYEAISAKYIIADNDAEIKSLELSASGNYIIVRNNGYYGNFTISSRDAFVNNLLISKATRTRSAEYENIIYGKFTQIDENKYELEGYGTVVITEAENEVYDLEIVRKNGKTLNVGAQKEEKFTDSAATNNLCRTWKITKVGLRVKLGFIKFTKLIAHEKIDELLKDYMRTAIEASGEELNEEEMNEAVDEAVRDYNESKPISMIFTKSGSYMVEYQNGELGISTWKWENEDEGIFRYSWNTEDINSENLGGVCTVSYKKGLLLITETLGAESEDDYYEEEEEDEGFASISILWGLEEVK